MHHMRSGCTTLASGLRVSQQLAALVHPQTGLHSYDSIHPHTMHLAMHLAPGTWPMHLAPGSKAAALPHMLLAYGAKHYLSVLMMQRVA